MAFDLANPDAVPFDVVGSFSPSTSMRARAEAAASAAAERGGADQIVRVLEFYTVITMSFRTKHSHPFSFFDLLPLRISS